MARVVSVDRQPRLPGRAAVAIVHAREKERG
jgi:hypothetical protein